ncbi:MAG: VWA domain-containing protein [Candidatus Methylomirabilales bacterium]
MTPGASVRAARGDLLENLGVFSRILREHGIVVTVAEECDAARALLHIDLWDPKEFYWALRAVLVVNHKDVELFDTLFWTFWMGQPAEVPEGRLEAAPGSVRVGPPREGMAGAGSGGDTEDEEKGAAGDDEAVLLGYSPEALLRKKSFEEMSPRDLEEMEQLLARMVFKLATRKSRRMTPSPRKTRVDLRRSFRATLRYGGEFVQLAHRERVIERPRIVLLCDVSGSMDSYSRFLIRFLLSLQRSADRVETFVFNTSLTHLTPLLAGSDVPAILAEISRTVPDWSGGTDIGGCLTEFLTHHATQVLGRDAVVVILSDGLDRGETELLAHAMQGIRKKARRVIWLNPLLGQPSYEPLCLGMKAALPFVDHFGAAHNLESLENLIRHLRV